MKLGLVTIAAALFLAPFAPSIPQEPAEGPAVATQSPRGPDALVLHSAGLDAWLVDAKDSGLRRALNFLDERLIELGTDLRQGGPPPEVVRFVCDVVRSPLCLRFGADDPTSPTGMRGQLTVRCTDTTQAREWVERIETLCTAGGVPLSSDDSDPTQRVVATPIGPIFFGTTSNDNGTYLRIALSEPVDETFTFPESELPGGATPVFFARYDGARIGKLLASKLGTEEPAWKVLSAFGLVGECAPVRTWAMGPVNGRMISVSRVAGWKHAAEELGVSALEPLTAEDFKRIPEDATIASLSQIHAAGLLGLLDKIEPGTRAKAIGMAHGVTGVDLEKELFDVLGPTFGFYMSRNTGGGGLLSTVAFIESSAAPTAAQALERLSQFALAAAAPKTEGRVALRPWTHGDMRCSSLVFPGLPVPLELSFAASENALWIAASPNALTAALDQTTAERSLLDHPVLTPEATSESVRFGFFDTPHFLQRGYGTASLLAAGLANAVRSPRDSTRDPGQVLPPFTALQHNVQPSFSWSRIEGEDLVSHASFERSWTAQGTAMCGTPFAASYAGLAGLGMVSSVAIPNLMSARLSANEAAAIATMRSICSAQAQFQASGIVDADGNGVGEYGFFGEMSGARPLRIGKQGLTVWDPNGEPIDPPVLSQAFGLLLDDGQGSVVVQRSGYYFQVWLPARATNGGIAGCGESAAWPPREAATLDTESAETVWCCYAWPVSPGSTGRRTFYVDQEGELLTSDGRRTYGGTFAQGGDQPAFDAAFNAGRNGTAVDGQVWRPLE